MSAHPIPNRLNAAIVCAQIALFVAVFWMASQAATWTYVFSLSLVFAVLGNSIYAIAHEAEHGILFSNRRANDLVGSTMMLLFPASFHLLRQSHLGHHFRNRSDDEAFDFYFDGENAIWKWLQLYGILTGLFWLVIVISNFAILLFPFSFNSKYFRFDRPSTAYMDSLNPSSWWPIRAEAFAAISLHALLIWALKIPLANYAIVYLGFGITWSAMQYVHHFGTQRDIIDGSRNLWLFAPIDWLWLHHNWHHTHHQHPTVPWIYLPRLSREQGAKREFLIWHYLRMWRGPRYTNEHVENRYAGRIIR